MAKNEKYFTLRLFTENSSLKTYYKGLEENPTVG